MRTMLSTVFAVLTLAAAARADIGPDHVKVDLLADTTAVQPGVPFTLGVRFKIDPGWHIYWTNPGDSGLPTRVKLDLPAGFKAGEVQYPVPTVLELPGEITNYGYERDLTLLVRVTPASTLSTATITAHVDYLVCSENSLPGRGDASITLPSGATALANTAMFDAWRARLPGRVPSALASRYERDPSSAGSGYHVRIAWPNGLVARIKEVQWLPPVVPGFDVDDVRVDTTNGVTKIDFKLTATGHEKPPRQATGLILYRQGDGTKVGFPFPIYPALEAGSPLSNVSPSGS